MSPGDEGGVSPLLVSLLGILSVVTLADFSNIGERECRYHVDFNFQTWDEHLMIRFSPDHVVILSPLRLRSGQAGKICSLGDEAMAQPDPSFHSG